MKHFEKCELFNSNLVLHARHFQHRVEIFFKEILLIPLSTIGKGSYYAIRIEFKVGDSLQVQFYMVSKSAKTFRRNLRSVLHISLLCEKLLKLMSSDVWNT